MPRFDPTAFVKAKEKKQRELRMKLAPVRSLRPCPLSPSLSLCLLHATRALLRLLLGCSASPSCPPDPPPASPGSSSGTVTD